MLDRSIIPLAFTAFIVSQWLSAGNAIAQQPSADCSQSGPVFIQQPGVWIQPSPPLEGGPRVPRPRGGGPRPAPLGGPIFAAPGQVAPGVRAPPAEAGSPVGPLAGVSPGGAISARV